MTYDHVIVCPGIQKDWDRIPGCRPRCSPLGASHYAFDSAARLRSAPRPRGGTVVFTQPSGPPRVRGIAEADVPGVRLLARHRGARRTSALSWWFRDPTVFGIPEIDRELERKIAEYGIELRTQTECSRWMPQPGDVLLGRLGGGRAERLPYDVLHIVPPQSAPDWLKPSRLPPPATLSASSRWTSGRCGIRGTRTSGRSGMPRRPQLEVRWGAAQADARARAEPLGGASRGSR